MNFSIEPTHNITSMALGFPHEPPPVPFHFGARSTSAPTQRAQSVAPTRAALRAPLFVNTFLPGRLNLGRR